MHKVMLLILSSWLLFFASLAHAEWIISPSVGYTLGGKVLDQGGNKYSLEGSESYALAIETPYEKGRIGVFYSGQPTEVRNRHNQDANIHYLHFQSSLFYPISDKLSSYIGLGIGGAYTDVAWANKKYGASATGFGGIEYKINSHMAINTQLRWLGTMVDNDSSAVCTLPSSENCVVKFKSDWLNQASAHVGMTIRF